ncbi:MAG: hypothetical protein Kow0069_14680 [Promethearchaeota archaeon]
MRWFVNRKKDPESRNFHVRAFMVAAVAATVASAAVVAGLGLAAFARPLVSTSYYHANIQFRAGDPASYDQIFNNSLIPILEMYERHPNWRYTLECQALLVEMAHENYTRAFELIKAQNLRGQLELVVPQYSHALVVAYGYRDFAASIQYARSLLEGEYGLKVSDVVVLQEGQWLPAFGQVAHLGFDAIIASRDQFSYHNYFPREPLLEWTLAGRTVHVIPVTWLPAVEAGVYHHQLVLSDSERVNTGDVEGCSGFCFNPDKMAQLEARHEELERLGNQFLTMSEWKEYCLSRGRVEKMNKFMPESHWTPARHKSVSRWMAWGTPGSSDDGQVLARNVYTSNRLFAAGVLLDAAGGALDPQARVLMEQKLAEANRHLWLAQVTDTTGVNPNFRELEYAIEHTAAAQALAAEVVAAVKAANGWVSPVQVNCHDRLVMTEPGLFSNRTALSVGTADLLESRYGFQLSVDWSVRPVGGSELNVTRERLACTVAGRPVEFEFDVLRANFTGRTGFFVPNDLPSLPALQFEGPTTSQFVTFKDDWRRVAYTPSLLDNATQNLTRADYRNPFVGRNDDYLVPLPLANGLIYNLAKGYALITNNEVRHVSVRWEDDRVTFYETGQDFDARYEFLLFDGSLEDALLLANLANLYPFVEV